MTEPDAGGDTQLDRATTKEPVYTVYLNGEDLANIKSWLQRESQKYDYSADHPIKILSRKLKAAQQLP